jgi:hypothetical protein
MSGPMSRQEFVRQWLIKANNDLTICKVIRALPRDGDLFLICKVFLPFSTIVSTPYFLPLR